MGLDITLGVIVFLAAIRGWLKGFLYQAVRIGALIACVYLADPVRKQVRPHIAPHFTSIQPEMLDRILWWAGCVVSYVVIVGVASLLVAIAKRPEEPGMKVAGNPNDRLGGFLLGAAKGCLVAIFVTAGIQKYALGQLAVIPWAEEQVKGSKALAWNQLYEPVPLIWQSGPIRQFVGHVQRMGLAAPEGSPPTPPTGQVAERTSQKPEGRHPRLTVPSGDSDEVGASASLGSETHALLDEIKAQLDQRPAGSTAR